MHAPSLQGAVPVLGAEKQLQDAGVVGPDVKQMQSAGAVVREDHLEVEGSVELGLELDVKSSPRGTFKP